MKWKCESCGTEFPEDGLKVHHLCSRVARSGMPGLYADCPICGPEQPITDLDPPPPLPAPPGYTYKGPTLRRIKPPGLIDSETISAPPPERLIFFQPPPREGDR